MDISGVSGPSMQDQLAQMATSQKMGSIETQITMAVAKQIKDSEQQAGELMVKLINSGPSFDQAVGRTIDQSA